MSGTFCGRRSRPIFFLALHDNTAIFSNHSSAGAALIDRTNFSPASRRPHHLLCSTTRYVPGEQVEKAERNDPQAVQTVLYQLLIDLQCERLVAGRAVKTSLSIDAGDATVVNQIGGKMQRIAHKLGLANDSVAGGRFHCIKLSGVWTINTMCSAFRTAPLKTSSCVAYHPPHFFAQAVQKSATDDVFIRRRH